MLKNLAALGLGNLEHASSIRGLNGLLKNDYRGIIVTMIHKFRDMLTAPSALKASSFPESYGLLDDGRALPEPLGYEG